MVLLKLRLVVEGVDLADAAAHEQRDHLLGARLEMRRLGQIGRTRESLPSSAQAAGLSEFGKQAIAVEQVEQRQSADADAGFEQEIAAGNEALACSSGVSHKCGHVAYLPS